jgi:hypothetical protein
MEGILEQEMHNVYSSQWNFLNNEYVKIERKYKHRTVIQPLKNPNIIEKIKNDLLKKLGYISVFYFIQLFFSFGDYPNPYKNIDKVLLVLYQIITGKSIKEMNEYIAYASFHDIQKKFWENNKDLLNKEVTNRLENMFSNIKIRILTAKMQNPDNFKGVTLFLDGHDSKVNYENIKTDKFDLYSYKLDRSGVRTQVCCDVNGFVIYVSSSRFCKDNADGQMFLKMKLEKKIDTCDCIAFDGGYYYYIYEFIENGAKIGKDFDKTNFIHPIRKEKGINLSNEELEFNKEFGSFRSTIETLFAKLGNKFNMFNNNHKITRITNVLTYNLKFKTMALLYNIQKFVEIYNIEANEIHKQWYNDDFDIKYTDEVDEPIQKYNYDTTIIDLIDNHDIIIGLQDKLLGFDFEDIGIYEVETILKHKGDISDRSYFVKWKNWSHTYNAWVSEKDFNEKEIINEYWNTIDKDMKDT